MDWGRIIAAESITDTDTNVDYVYTTKFNNTRQQLLELSLQLKLNHSAKHLLFAWTTIRNLENNTRPS